VSLLEAMHSAALCAGQLRCRGSHPVRR